MLNGIPIWKNLKNNGTEHNLHIIGGDYGSFAERMGKREINKKIKYEKFIQDIFPDIDIVSIAKYYKFKNKHRSLEYGDYCIEISYHNKETNTYGKKILIIEIKHGKVQISQQQIKRYSEFIINPSAYFRKADEVKIIFMIFTEINTLNATASYFISEFNKEFANKIKNAVPIEYNNTSENLFSTFEDTK